MEINTENSLPRVLTNPKLHRRQGTDSLKPALNEAKKHKCPPIEQQKEYPALIPHTDKYRTSSHYPQKKENIDHVHSPLSPADVLSPVCAAMANACSHDHDYSTSNHVSNNDDATAALDAAQSIDVTMETYRPRLESKNLIRIPIPPKVPAHKSPLNFTAARDIGPRHHRRIVKPSTEIYPIASELDPATVTQKNEMATNDSCIFISSCKTAQPIKRSRARRKIKAVKNESDTEVNQQIPSSSSSRSTSATASETSKTNSDDRLNSDSLIIFDVSTDKLTVEWQKMVRKCKGEIPEDLSEDEGVVLPLDHSTPARCKDESGCSLPMPRKSVTPCPPETMRPERPNETNEDVDEHDSTYFSMDSSISSMQPTESNGVPVFRSSASTGSRSRPTTGQASIASNRPPSGGKRVAVASLSSSSSSSSGGSSDDDSLDCSSSARIAVEKETDSCENKIKERTSSVDSFCSTTDFNSQEHKVVKLRKGKKFVRQVDGSKPKKESVNPLNRLSLRKPKKDPLPMHHRALPPSFFQEPNKVNLYSYSTLPPLQPLFRQAANDDIADLRPVTPIDEAKDQDDFDRGGNDQNQKVVIRRGDTDLLNRLFDAVDPQHQASGRKTKRGRPKRPPRILPSPKLKLDNNPCIMQSITEKLFPNLSIEKRNQKQRSLRNQLSSVMLAADKAYTGSTVDPLACTSTTNFDMDPAYEKDLSHFGFLSFNPSSYDEEQIDCHTETSSPGLVTQRLALPQLPLSQMLSEVAAKL